MNRDFRQTVLLNNETSERVYQFNPDDLIAGKNLT